MLAIWSVFKFKNILGYQWTESIVAAIRPRISSLPAAIVVTANAIINPAQNGAGKVVRVTIIAIIVRIWVYLDDEFLESIRTN